MTLRRISTAAQRPKEVEMKTIVLGYDGSESAKRALERAAQLAKAFSARVMVTSVAPLLVSAGYVDPVDPPEEHQAQLAEAKALLAEAGVEADVRLAAGVAPEAIVHVAEEAYADMIVVGTRELGFFERILHGSVSDGVEHRAHCDVLIVH
jgi:nucleotide-binding universal stress UspA family protein